MNQKNRFLVGLTALSLTSLSPLTASSWEMPPAELTRGKGRAVDATSLKAVFEQRKNAIREAAPPSLAPGPRMEGSRAGAPHWPGASPAPPLPPPDEAAPLANEPAYRVAAALRYDPNRVYRTLAAQPPDLPRIDAVLHEVRDHINRSAIPQIEKDVKSSALRAVRLGLKSRIAGETAMQTIVPAARGNSTTGGLE